MKFPDLIPEPWEMREHVERAGRLGKALEEAIADRFGIDSEVSCRGSTEKGTALPGHLFNLDYDMSILGVDKVLDRIALRSELFEGCQILKLELALSLAEYFDDIYYAGHRVSGRFEGSPFDLSIADPRKDQWKIDFNSSPILDFSQEQLSELRKMKYLMKRMNTYGSQAYGIVGPACELAIANFSTLDRVLECLRILKPITNKHPFSKVRFPDGYKRLFPESEDYVVKGVIGSFRYTMPNTYNRMIRVACKPTTEPLELIENNAESFEFRTSLLGDFRFVSFMLNGLLCSENAKSVELMDEGGLVLYATTGNASITDAVQRIIETPERGIVNTSLLPKITQRWLEEHKISLFRGMPGELTDGDRLFVPLDIVVRNDREKLVELMREGMRGTD